MQLLSTKPCDYAHASSTSSITRFRTENSCEALLLAIADALTLTCRLHPSPFLQIPHANQAGRGSTNCAPKHTTLMKPSTSVLRGLVIEQQPELNRSSFHCPGGYRSVSTERPIGQWPAHHGHGCYNNTIVSARPTHHCVTTINWLTTGNTLCDSVFHHTVNTLCMTSRKTKHDRC